MSVLVVLEISRLRSVRLFISVTFSPDPFCRTLIIGMAFERNAWECLPLSSRDAITFAMENAGENMGVDVRTISIGEAAVLVARLGRNSAAGAIEALEGNVSAPGVAAQRTIDLVGNGVRAAKDAFNKAGGGRWRRGRTTASRRHSGSASGDSLSSQPCTTSP
jgi:hypothetical protein